MRLAGTNEKGKAMQIELSDGQRVEARFVRHLRVLTRGSGMGGRNVELALYRLTDGREVVAADDGFARTVPVESKLTEDAALFAE